MPLEIVLVHGMHVLAVGLPGVAMFFKVAGVCKMNEQYKIADWLNKRGAPSSRRPWVVLYPETFLLSAPCR